MVDCAAKTHLSLGIILLVCFQKEKLWHSSADSKCKLDIFLYTHLTDRPTLRMILADAFCAFQITCGGEHKLFVDLALFAIRHIGVERGVILP